MKVEGKPNEYDEGDADGGYFEKWTRDMNDRISTSIAPNCKWHWKPQLGDLVWEDYEDLRSGKFTRMYGPHTQYLTLLT